MIMVPMDDTVAMIAIFTPPERFKLNALTTALIVAQIFFLGDVFLSIAEPARRCLPQTTLGELGVLEGRAGKPWQAPLINRFSRF